jgi:hypothetical protein
VETLATIMSYASGFFLMRYHGSPADIIGTSIAINLALAPLTALIAYRRGRNTPLWLALGLAFGLWALAAILLMGTPREHPLTRTPDRQVPPTSHAA